MDNLKQSQNSINMLIQSKQVSKALGMLEFDSKRWNQLKTYVEKLDNELESIFDESRSKLDKALPIQDIFIYRKYEKKYNKLVHHYNFIVEVANDARQNMIDDVNNIIDLFQEMAPNDIKLINSYKKLLNKFGGMNNGHI